MIGQSLGHYKILEKLGAGGMGEVYRAEDTSLKRQVALKVLPPDLASSQERLERFQREAETLAALDHPNIVTVFTVEHDEDVHFLTMQLVEGKRLSELIPKGGMPLERIFEIAIPQADALAAAHEKGVIHRDLKPANIMLSDDGRVKVLDFGLAKLRLEAAPPEATGLPTEPLTEEGRALGTVPYMSPEQLEGRDLDARTDIFSLGVILYEMATGERPFQGDTSASVISAIMRDTPREVDVLRTELPHHLGRIVRHSLEKDPNERFQSARDIRNQLDDLAQELKTEKILKEHKQPGAAEPPGKRIHWPLVAVSLVVVLVAVLVAFRFARRGIEEPASGELPPIESLAVLPFDNLMNDPEQDYFVEGMHDALIAELAQIGALTVISRQSVLRYRATEKSIPEIAQELRVDAVVEGSVFRAGETVRITAQLLQALPTERHLWAGSYEKDLRDVLALQREVAQAVATEINVTVTGAQQARLTRDRVVDPQAYDYYLRGNQYFERGLGGPDILIAVEMYERSVASDPTFALAYAALAKALARIHFQRYDPTEEVAGKSLSAVERALALDPDLPEARAAMGWHYYWARRDIDRALEEFLTALRSQPNNSDILLAVGLSRRRQGKWDQALRDLELAFELDPLSNEKATEVGISYFYARQYEAAEDYFDRAISIAPDHHRAYMHLASAHIALDHSLDRALGTLKEGASVIGRLEFAKRAIGFNHAEEPIWLVVQEFEEEFKSIPPEEFGSLEPMYLNYMAEFHARHGRRELQRTFAESALAVLQGVETPSYTQLSRAHANLGHKKEAIQAAEEAIGQRPVADDARSGPDYVWNSARVLAMLSEVDAAIVQLEYLFSIPSNFSLGSLAIDPTWDPLRDHPRFQALLEYK